jgi:nucleoid-associated protein YgaU
MPWLNAPPTHSQPVNREAVITGSSFETEMRAMGNETGKPDFSDVQGGVKSTAPDAPPKADFSDVQSQVSSTADETTDYTVVAGDSLSKIAKHFYGNANVWKQIFDANRDQLSDPDKIRIGQVLKIPAKS